MANPRNQALDATTDAPSALALSRKNGGVRAVKERIDEWLRDRGLTRTAAETHSYGLRRHHRRRRNLPRPILAAS